MSEEETAKDREMEVAAKLELEEWYTKYREKISKIRSENSNRETEASGQDNGENLDWENVVNLCGLKNPKSVKDTSRLKSILLKLKDSQ